MATVAQLLESKGSDIWTISPDATVYEAIEQMARQNVGALLVVDADRLVGIISERDYARKVILKGHSSHETPVRDIMSSQVVYVRPQQTVDECMALMTERHIRHLPVLDGERIAGMISIGDIVRAQIADKDDLIQQLHTYITGGR